MKTASLVIAALVALTGPARATVAALAPCARLYASVVFDGAVDYAKVAAHPDRAACTRAIAEAKPPEAPEAPEAASVAFWADVYNLVSMLALAEEPARYGVQQDGASVFRDRVFTIAGRRMTLDELERVHLAKHTRDPRVEFLLSCGSRSCSLLPPALLSAQDETQASIDHAMLEGMRRWFARPENLSVVRDAGGGGVVEIGQLLQTDWHGGDFEKAGMPLIPLIAGVLEKDRHDPVAAADLKAGRLKLRIRPYDWRVNRVRKVFALP